MPLTDAQRRAVLEAMKDVAADEKARKVPVMSELGDDFRRMRRERQEHKRQNSHLCWKCQARVWNDEAECSKCGTQNERHQAQQKTPL